MSVHRDFCLWNSRNPFLFYILQDFTYCRDAVRIAREYQDTGSSFISIGGYFSPLLTLDVSLGFSGVLLVAEEMYSF